MFLVSKLKKNRAGFTLIELIVVIAILAILAGVIIPSMIRYLTYSQKKSEESDTRSAYSAACQAYNTVITNGDTYATNDAFTKALEEETLRLMTGNPINPPDDTHPGHLYIYADQERGVIGLTLSFSGGCVCTYDAEQDSGQEVSHDLPSHQD